MALGLKKESHAFLRYLQMKFSIFEEDFSTVERLVKNEIILVESFRKMIYISK